MNKILNTLGICKASGNLVYGEKMIEAITKNKTYVIVMATDVAANNEKKIVNKTTFYNVQLIKMFTREELSKAIGGHNTIAVGIIDKNLAQKIKEVAEV